MAIFVIYLIAVIGVVNYGRRGISALRRVYNHILNIGTEGGGAGHLPGKYALPVIQPYHQVRYNAVFGIRIPTKSVWHIKKEGGTSVYAQQLLRTDLAAYLKCLSLSACYDEACLPSNLSSLAYLFHLFVVYTDSCNAMQHHHHTILLDDAILNDSNILSMVRSRLVVVYSYNSEYPILPNS